MKKFENLTAVYFDEANNFYELQFDDGENTEYIRVDASDHPEAATDEDYFDNREVVEKIIAESDDSENEEIEDRSYLYGQLFAVIECYEEEAREYIGKFASTYWSRNVFALSNRPYTYTKLYLEYLDERTQFSKIFKRRNPDREKRLRNRIGEILAEIEKHYGDNNEPLTYMAAFGENKEKINLGI